MVLAYAVSVVVVAVICYGLLVFAAPRRYQVKVTRRLPAPAERIWAWVSEPARFPEWFPDIVSCTHAGGPERGVGQLRRVTRERAGRRGEREEEVTVWDEPRRIELVHRWERRDGRDVPWVEARSEYRLAPAADGTDVTGVLWFSGRGALGRVFSLLSLRKRHEKEFLVALEQLERRLREDAPPPRAGTGEPASRPAGAGPQPAMPR